MPVALPEAKVVKRQMDLYSFADTTGLIIGIERQPKADGWMCFLQDKPGEAVDVRTGTGGITFARGCGSSIADAVQDLLTTIRGKELVRLVKAEGEGHEYKTFATVPDDLCIDL